MRMHYHLKMSTAHYQTFILLLTSIFSCGERPWTLEWQSGYFAYTWEEKVILMKQNPPLVECGFLGWYSCVNSSHKISKSGIPQLVKVPKRFLTSTKSGPLISHSSNPQNKRFCTLWDRYNPYFANQKFHYFLIKQMLPWTRSMFRKGWTGPQLDILKAECVENPWVPAPEKFQFVNLGLRTVL